MHTINLEDFKFSKTKITSFRLVDSSNPELHSLLGDWSLLAAKRGMKNVITPQNLLVRNQNNINLSQNSVILFMTEKLIQNNYYSLERNSVSIKLIV